MEARSYGAAMGLGALLVAGCGGSPGTVRIAAERVTTSPYTLPLASGAGDLSHGLRLKVSIGGGRDKGVEIDTGSRGLVVARGAVGSAAKDTGQSGSIEYTSDGLRLKGEYFLTPVTFHSSSGDVSTVPIRVLGVESSSCDPAYPKCRPDRSVDGVGVLGVGYKQYASLRGQPTAEINPFLQVQAMADGSLPRGYIIERTGVTLGLTTAAAASFTFMALQPPAGGSKLPGDWGPAPACFTFPDRPPARPYCGSMLFDTGIGSMIIGLPPAQRPAGLATQIPTGTRITIAAPGSGDPVLGYTAAIGVASDPLAPQGDPAARWSAAGPFVNTGRHVLAGFDYAFDAAGGRIGFRTHRS